MSPIAVAQANIPFEIVQITMPVGANWSAPAPPVNRICAQRPDGVFRFKGLGEQPTPPKMFLVGQLVSMPQTKATQNLISHPEFLV
eukprot:3915153-Heterocapsa_arctica.AAC.1